MGAIFAAAVCSHRIEASGRLDRMITEAGEGGEGVCGGKARKIGHHRHIGEIEAARGTCCGVVVVGREMAIAIGVGARGSDMCWIEDVGVHKVELLWF